MHQHTSNCVQQKEVAITWYFVVSILTVTWSLTSSVPALPQDDPAAIAKRKDAHQPRMSYLDNGTLKIGVDLNLGGAITHLSRSKSDDNLVNNWDWGRQIQMSHYSGPSPFRVEGKAVAKAWEKFPWNPVQAGDHFGHASKLLDSKNDGNGLYIKCRPMQWSLENAPSECAFETWIKLDGSTANVRCRLTADRADKSQYAAHSQELPALYLNGPYHRLFSYTGDKPFTNGELSRIEKKKGGESSFPWARFRATENWAALVNDDAWGVGVWQPGCVAFLGGFAGKHGNGGTKDAPTGYIAPIRNEIIDHNIVYEYSYTLIVGTLADIRKQVYMLAGKPKLPRWQFTSDRQGWTYLNAVDAGWAIRGELSISLEKSGVQLISPVACWRAEDAPLLKVEAAFPASVNELKIYWVTLAEPKFAEERSTTVLIRNDGEFHALEVKLSDSTEYRGAITQLRLDPISVGKDQRLRVKAIELQSRPKK